VLGGLGLHYLGMTTGVRGGVWRFAPVALVVLGVVPVLAGFYRLVQLVVGGPVTVGNARFFASPVPIVLHIVGASVFSVVGAFQFAPRLRRWGWHRVAGRVLVVCGLVAGFSGVWLTLFYPRQPGDGDLLDAFRIFFGAGLVVAIVLAVLAVWRRDFRAHRAWMMRAYAIGLGAGSQAVLFGLWAAVGTGEPVGVGRALLLAGGWVVNLVVAEGIILRGKYEGSGSGPLRFARRAGVHRGGHAGGR
jgi:hypothetical protein